jgi:transcriptional regulator with AbiEi antitoxin domain of type IV toxin-antitoxin system
MPSGLPEALTRAPLRTIRPQDLVAIYTQPSVQLHRLTSQGRIRKVAHGYYYALPDDQGPNWTANLEAVAAGIATAIYGERIPVLMHLSAARLHGALPRAIGTAIVAVPRKHHTITLASPPGAQLVFVQRDVDRLDATLNRTDLGLALGTSVEQTVLDLTKRPGLGNLRNEATAAVAALLPQCDADRLDELASSQNMRSTLARLRAHASRASPSDLQAR